MGGLELPIPPLTSEPEDHLDDLGGINRPELEQARINKHKELLTPDPVSSGMATLSAQMAMFEGTMKDIHRDLQELIKVLKHLGERHED